MKRTLLVCALLATALTACGKKEEAAPVAPAPAATAPAPAADAAKPVETAPAAAPHTESKS